MEADNTNKKTIMVAFVAAAFLAHLVTRVLFETFSGSFAAVQKAYAIEVVRHGLPLGVALLTFAVLQFNKKAHTVIEEAIIEIRKIVWPSQKDTFAMTAVVCVMVVIAGLGLSLIDFLSSQLIQMLVN